jgi:hypothetical protein
VEEGRVVASHVRPHPRLVLDLNSLLDGPPVALVDGLLRRRFERGMVKPDRVAVVRAFALGLRLANPQRRSDSLAVEVPDRLAALAFHVIGLQVPERSQQLPIEGQAALERGHDDVDVVEAHAAHWRHAS